jgi:ubiquitin-protein ligase E3 D
MQSQSHISAYAELLSNIRQVSVAVSLPSPSDLSTRATLAADGCNVHISHQGASCHLRLPAKAAIGATALTVQSQGVPTLSWRLPVSPDALPQLNGSQEATPLWSATDLEADSGVQCRNCSAVIVEVGSVTWKDLPSENWAEMMEFWHCHKPADHGHSHDHSHAGKADEASLAARGYGASSAISAQKSVGFVDLTTLLFPNSDCNGLTVSLRLGASHYPSLQSFLPSSCQSLHFRAKRR